MMKTMDRLMKNGIVYVKAGRMVQEIIDTCSEIGIDVSVRMGRQGGRWIEIVG